MASIAHRVTKLASKRDQRELIALLTDIVTDLNALKTAINTHTHGGITTGAGTSGAPNANTAGTLVTTT